MSEVKVATREEEEKDEHKVCSHKWKLSIYCEWCCENVKTMELKGFHYDD